MKNVDWDKVAELQQSGIQIMRTDEIGIEIASLLKGTVADLMTPKGRVLRPLFTVSEIDAALSLPCPEAPPDFDGTTCGWCRGNARFRQCQHCRGEFGNLSPIWNEDLKQREAELRAAHARQSFEDIFANLTQDQRQRVLQQLLQQMESSMPAIKSSEIGKEEEG